MGSYTTTAAAAALALSLTLFPPPAGAGEVAVSAVFGGSFRVPTLSMKEGRFRTVFEQKHDFSCGSAALASLLHFHYDRPTTEKDVFEAMYAAGDKARIEKLGFSLLDMKQYLGTLGIPSDGYRVPLAKLKDTRLPTIALIDTQGYKHFVLVKGIADGQVLIGDPARGLRAVPSAEFEAMWNGIAFVIKAEVKRGRASFNGERDWRAMTRVPFGTALARTALATFTASLYRAGRLY